MYPDFVGTLYIRSASAGLRQVFRICWFETSPHLRDSNYLHCEYFLRCTQRRNEEGQGGRTCPDAEKLTMSQVLSSTAHLLPEDLRFEHRGAKLVSCPGRHL